MRRSSDHDVRSNVYPCTSKSRTKCAWSYRYEHRTRISDESSRIRSDLEDRDMKSSSSEITPPPSKRRRIETSEPNEKRLASSIPSRPITELGRRDIRVLSWNINGTGSFLQPTISAYFTKPSQVSSHRGASQQDQGPDDSASLRKCLERWRYPHVVCLQEVEIASKDSQTVRAVHQAVNSPTNRSPPSREEIGYHAFFNLPTDRYNARGFGGKLYGVCTLVRKDFLEKETNGEASVLQVD